MGLRRLLNCDEVPMNIEQFCPNWFEPTVGWFSFACLTIRPCELLGGCFKYVLVYPGKMSKNLAKMSASPTHTTSHFVQRFSIRLRENKFGWQLLAAPWWLCSYPPAVFFPWQRCHRKAHSAWWWVFVPLPPSTRNKSLFRSSQLMEFPLGCWGGKTPRSVNCTIPLGSWTTSN